jgi:hypothetical protein
VGAFEDAVEAADDLAAGDEVEEATGVLRHISQQLEALGGGDAAPQPLGHITVPREKPRLALPAGTVTVNFRDGFVEHEDIGRVIDDLVTVEDLTDQFEGESVQLQNVIFHSDTAAQVRLQEGGQYVPLDYVPLPSRSFDTVQVELLHPGNLLLLASTQELPIGIGAINLYASRYGEQAGTLDSPTAVPVSPHELWDNHNTSYADSTVWTAAYDSTTWTVENTSGNSNDLVAVIEAAENTSTSLGSFREIARDTIPDGDHSTFHVEQRHHYQRVRLTNTATGETVSGTVEALEGSP